MKLRTGQRGTCSTCAGEIYFSEARDPGDPWVHSDWTKHLLPTDNPHAAHSQGKLPPYDHPAQPVMHDFTFTVTIETPVNQQPVVRHDIAQALRDSDRFMNVEVQGQ